MPFIKRALNFVNLINSSKPSTFVKFYAANLPKPAIKDIPINQISFNNSLKKYKVKTPRLHLVNLDKPNSAVRAFASAEEYNLEKLWESLNAEEFYTSLTMPNVLQVQAKHHNSNQNHSIFFFRDGVTVFWNPEDPDIKKIMEKVKLYSTNTYEQSLIDAESDSLDFNYHENSTKFQDGKIYLQNKQLNILELYTFSNSLSQSVKLAIWEDYFDKYAESIEKLVEELKCNVVKISEKEILQKAGELFALRHLVNLSSDLLDSPDFYWDRDNLETLYRQSCSYLNIPRRTRVINEKINHCCDIINLLKTYVNDKHHIRLEWMIIILILVEVFLGLLTTYKIYEPSIESAYNKKIDVPEN